MGLTALFLAATLQNGLPPNLIDSVCFVESGHDVMAIHQNDGGSPSFGVCQLKLVTAQWLGFKGTEKQLMNPKYNTYYAAKYLAKNLKRYHGHVGRAVIAYNQGHAGTLTSTKYSDKVLKQWRNYEHEMRYLSVRDELRN